MTTKSSTKTIKPPRPKTHHRVTHQWSKLIVLFSIALSVLTIGQYAFAQNNSVNISATVISLVEAKQSSIISPDSVHISDGQSTYRIIINARTAWGTAMPQKQVILTSDQGGDLILPTQRYTDAEGQAIFQVVARQQGLANYTATIDHMVVLAPLTIQWVAPNEAQVLGASTNDNDPIRTIAFSAIILFILAFSYHLVVRLRQDARLN